MMSVRFILVKLALCSLCQFCLVAPGLAFAQEPENASATSQTRSQASVTHAGIPFKQDKQSTDTLAYQSFAVLVLVGLAAYGIVFALKRFGGIAGGALGNARRVRTIETIRLSRRSTLYVIEYRGQELLLAENEHGIQLVTSSPTNTQADAQGQDHA